ncbi:MAG: hypothetical protein ACRDKZ_08180 [Actinomycetota bacterium]
MQERRSNKQGPKADDAQHGEEEALERSGRESHVEEEREKEGEGEGAAASGHRVSGSGSSADDYSYTDHGEEGGASHPKPKDDN